MQNSRIVQFTLAILIASMLAACGFQLRGSVTRTNLPFKTLYLAAPEGSALAADLRRYLVASGVTVTNPDSKSAEATLEVLAEARDKVVLTLNSQGRVREYTLLYKLSLRVKDSKGAELLGPTEITIKRTISFNESQVLAKESEEAMLYRDMQSDLVQQVMRRLEAIKPL